MSQGTFISRDLHAILLGDTTPLRTLGLMPIDSPEGHYRVILEPIPCGEDTWWSWTLVPRSAPWVIRGELNCSEIVSALMAADAAWREEVGR